MKGVSIIVCCYNSANRLPETLLHLARQQVSKALQWEVVLVNNNSTDTTPQVAKKLWSDYGEPVQMVIIDELQSGLSYARRKGIMIANYDILLWCDDDNWLCENYVQTAFDIMEQNSEIGALGGWCEGAFEIEKPSWFDLYAKYFAVSKQGNKSGDITHNKGCLYGAGMVLRKTHHIELERLGFRQLLDDRIGSSLSSGGDTEYCFALRLLGYKMWYDERLYFKHFMTEGRLSLNYVSRIRKAMTYSNFMLWSYLDLLSKKPKSRLDFIRLGLRRLPYLFFKKFGALLIGDFEQKETAKRYFRNLGYRFFKYSTYRNNIEFLKTWNHNI